MLRSEPSWAARFDAVVSSDSLGKIGTTASQAMNEKIRRYGRLSPSMSRSARNAVTVGASQSSARIASAPNKSQRKRGNLSLRLPSGARSSAACGSVTALATLRLLPVQGKVSDELV